MAKKQSPNFEASLEKLEGIVNALEAGELTLEESLSTFEEGVKLTRLCQSALQEAEQRVTILLEKNGETEEADFDSSSLE